MARSIGFPIEPSIIKYARKNTGYSLEEVFRKTKVSVEKLQLYEEERTNIPLSHLEKFANLYKRPLAFFLLQKIPEGVILPKDFRIVYSKEFQGEFTPKFYLAIRRARYVQSVLKELAGSNFEYKLPSITLNENIEKLGEWFRKDIGVSFDLQKKWQDPSNAFREWRLRLETKNIFILQANLSNDSISGLCLTDEKPYVIVLNSSEHEYRRIFSLFHEVGHILLRKSGACNPDDLSKNSYEYIQIEKFCNQFAAAVLLPINELKGDQNIISLINKPVHAWSKEEIKQASNRFKVSREVLLRKLLTLGYINENHYEHWRTVFQEEANEFVKPKKKNVIIPQYIKCISQNGRGFTSFILNQYQSNKITFNAAADILNIAPKHIGTLEARFT